jgi:hypothetical protein
MCGIHVDKYRQRAWITRGQSLDDAVDFVTRHDVAPARGASCELRGSIEKRVTVQWHRIAAGAARQRGLPASKAVNLSVMSQLEIYLVNTLPIMRPD